MAENSFQEKTERATPKRRREAREKGNVPRSMEVSSAIVLLVVGVMFIVMGKTLFREISTVMEKVFSNLMVIQLDQSNLRKMVLSGGLAVAGIAGPIMISIFFAGIFGNVIQSGITFSGQAIQPKLEKISPIAGFKRMFSLRSLVELVKNILKMLVIGYIGYHTIKNEFVHFFDLSQADVIQIASFIGAIIIKLFLKVGFFFVILAALDFAYQKYEYEKNLRMTKEEVKEEYKQTEGDPLVKSRIRSIQRERARSRMLGDVPNADVVITNPTHVAVALKYDPEKSTAPIVVAKGMRKIAQKIKEIARENGVPIVEKPIVARMLYKSAEIGDEIPVDLYQVVAEILAYVYQVKTKK